MGAKKRSHIIYLISLLGMIMPVVAQANSRVPDSLYNVQKQLNAIFVELVRCEREIKTPADFKRYESRIEQLEDIEMRLKNEYPISQCDELWNYITLFDEHKQKIQDNVEEWKNEQVRLALLKYMNNYVSSFDTLLTVGKEYESKKSADSVRSIKQKAENKWEKVCELKSANKQLFETDSLKALYSRAEYIKEEIKLLSEKEKTKIRDILLVVAAVAGAATLIISLLASRISMLKTLKKQNETTFTI